MGWDVMCELSEEPRLLTLGVTPKAEIRGGARRATYRAHLRRGRHFLVEIA